MSSRHLNVLYFAAKIIILVSKESKWARELGKKRVRERVRQESQSMGSHSLPPSLSHSLLLNEGPLRADYEALFVQDGQGKCQLNFNN